MPLGTPAFRPHCFGTGAHKSYCGCDGNALSISHDIIVKQQAASTQPGEFTECKIVLLRIANAVSQIRRTSMKLLILVIEDEPVVGVLFRAAFPAA
jgi:hypothetical protein